MATTVRPHFIMNMVGATFADSIVTTTPVLLMQDKQQVTCRREVLSQATAALGEEAAEFTLMEDEEERPHRGKRQKSAPLESVQDEHKVFSLSNLDHIFVYTTDLRFDPEEETKLQDNEVVIHARNRQLFHGRLLTCLKACCVKVMWSVSSRYAYVIRYGQRRKKK